MMGASRALVASVILTSAITRSGFKCKVKHCFNLIFQLTSVGSIFEDLDGHDLVVDLSNNSIRFLTGITLETLEKLL